MYYGFIYTVEKERERERRKERDIERKEEERKKEQKRLQEGGNFIQHLQSGVHLLWSQKITN